MIHVHEMVLFQYYYLIKYKSIPGGGGGGYPGWKAGGGGGSNPPGGGGGGSRLRPSEVERLKGSKGNGGRAEIEFDNRAVNILYYTA